MNLPVKFLSLVFITAFCSWSVGQEDAKKTRRFDFVYQASVHDVPDGSKVRIWIPVAGTTAYQSVSIKSKTFPGEVKLNTEPKYNNQMYYLEMAKSGSGQIAFRLDYEVLRNEAVALGQLDKEKGQQLELFLKPNAKVPVDGRPVETFEGYKKGKSIQQPGNDFDSGRLFYDFVEDHMKYDKSKPGYGTGDSVWACDSKTGNCTDFHSLFISVARANKVPAKFQIGFPLPAERGQGKIGGYHCWAKFHTEDRGWVPVDISEADKDPSKKDYFFGTLNENRIQFTTGRDIELSPKQDGEPLNYFVYPYVEVDGKPYPKEKIKLSFSYKDR